MSYDPFNMSMNQSALFLTLNQRWIDAIQWANQQFTDAGMRTVSTFDFQAARSAQVECTCPHHGTESCNCQMVVLLVYDGNRLPVSLLIHGNDDHTWFYLADSPSQRGDPELEAAVRQILGRNHFDTENRMETPMNPDNLEADSEKIVKESKPEFPNRRERFGAWLSKVKLTLLWTLVTMVALVVGSIAGYQLGIHQSPADTNPSVESQEARQAHELAAQVNPSKGYTLTMKYGYIGPKLLNAGAINFPQFEQIYSQAGKPLTDEQKSILKEGSDQEIVFNSQTAYFLLNFFWALGLTNQNTILTQGPMMEKGKAQVGNFASTGGWTIGSKAPTDLYASASILSLTSEQQALLESVAKVVYRPCCDNPTHFPECNHGMAMLGLLELMASRNATADQMFQAAKYVNAFWYPQQTLEIATLFQALQNVDFNHADASQVVSARYSSGSGFQSVHSYLVKNNLLPQAPAQGGSCGV